MFGRAVGAAVVGAAAGSVLTDAIASPARAAASTIVQQGAVAPTVVALTDAATIAVDASLGNDYRVTIGGHRTMGNPSNPTDGQQVVFQVTQGAGGSNTVTWGSNYAFSTGLPQPTLSTAAGDSDLLEFVYNATLGQWLLTDFVPGFNPATSPSPSPSATPSATPSASTSTTPPPAGSYRIFPSTNGPATPVSYGGNFIAGVAFYVTQAGCWFEGYWWWVCESGQGTSPVKCALWQASGDSTAVLVPNSVATSGTLTAGAWNYIPLTTPLNLSVGVSGLWQNQHGTSDGSCMYIAAVGVNGSFPETANQFGAGQPFAAGITNGPLVAPSDQGGSLPPTYNISQSLFSTASGDPSTSCPVGGYESSNFWVDVQVSTTAPSSYAGSYRGWPNYPAVTGELNGDYTTSTSANEFWLSAPCELNNLWFFSPTGAHQLPQRCAIWDIATQTEVAGTDMNPPSWSGAAGSGWVAQAYSGVVLAAGKYRVAVWNGINSTYYNDLELYYGANPSSGVNGPGASNIVNGPLTFPSQANASNANWQTGLTRPAQGTLQQGPWAFPNTYETGAGPNGNLELRPIDVEITPTSS